MTTAERPADLRARTLPYPAAPPPGPPNEARGRPSGSSRMRVVALLLAGMVAIAALVPARDLWPVQLSLLALLLLVPGSALLRALRVPPSAVRAMPVYVPAASLAVLMAAGLAVDLLGPEAGVERPLRTLPLLIGVEAACAVLVAVVALSPALAESGATRRSSRALIGLRHLWPLVLPLASAAGAARLTNGDGDLVAISAVSVAVAVLLIAGLAGARLDNAQLALILFGVALALAWSFSLRGGSVYGFDISGELPILENTNEAGIWNLSHPSDAYGAMLSLTVLPALLQSLTGLSALVLLKAVYPALLALVPVTVFLIARRHLPAQYAFAAGAFLVVQPNFAQQLPAVARQEVGLLAFAVLLAAAMDRRIPRWPRWSLVAALGLTLVVSHYSSAYLAIAIFACAVVLQLLTSLARPVPRVTGALVVALVVVAGGAAAWYGPLTDSSSNLTRFTESVREDGLRILPNREAGQGILDSYLKGNLMARATPGEYAALAKADYAATRDFVTPLPDAAAPRYQLRDAAPSEPPARSETAERLGDRSLLVVVQLANLLAIVGALILVARRRTRPGLRVVALIGLAALVSLAFVRLSGTIAANYNQDRAFIQALVPLAVGLAWLAYAASRRLGRLAPAAGVAVALALGVIALNSSGLVRAALDHPLTNLASRGEDYERYYVTRPELASADWLRTARYRGGVLYTDRYGQLRLISQRVSTEGLLLDITPETLDRDAWIYATPVNLIEGRARGISGDHYATYRFPSRFIGDNWNTVYANGSSAVYHR